MIHGELLDKNDPLETLTANAVAGESEVTVQFVLDLLVTNTSVHHWLYDVMFEVVSDRLAENAYTTMLLTYPQELRRHTLICYLFGKYVF